MKTEKGITIISLVVTVVILIILSGISINLTLGEDGLITKAKQAKENIELAQIEEQNHLNELYTGLNSQLGSSGDISYDAIAKLAEFKKQISDYIDEAGGIKPDYTAETTTFGNSIKGILKEVTKEATATSEDIIQGKTAYVNGELITGTKEEKLGAYIELIYSGTDYANSTTPFSITLDLSEYRAIYIPASGSDNYWHSFISAVTSDDKDFIYNNAWTSYNKTAVNIRGHCVGRTVTISTSGISFGQTYMYNCNTNSMVITTLAWACPSKIYGIK